MTAGFLRATSALSTACALVVLGGMSAAANAADPNAGAPIIANFFDGAAPGSVAVAGITVYGTVDFSAVHNSHGAEPTSTLYQGAPYQISKYSGRSQYLATDNALSQSFVGVKTNVKLSDIVGSDGLAGWSFISDAQIGFNPAYADIADACKTLRLNNGVSGLAQTANLDGNRCGQIFNGNLYGGLKNNDLGQLTYGRHTSLLADALNAGDPEAGSYAFSFITFSGTIGGGAGATEDVRWNNSIRYSNTIGIFRVAGMYRFEGMEQGGNAYSISGGVDLPGPLKGLSIDSAWAHFNSAIVSSPLSAGDCASLGASTTCQQLDILAGTVQDDDAWAISAKYNLGHFGLDTVTAMGGYEHINTSNPSSQLTDLRTIGGYGLFAGDLNYNKYETSRELDIFWFGGKWAVTPKVTLAGAWYHEDQNTFLTDKSATSATPSPCNGKTGTAASGNCAGSLDWVSASIDYQWTKRLDVYAGLSYTQADNGLVSGFTFTDTLNPVIGARFRF